MTPRVNSRIWSLFTNGIALFPSNDKGLHHPLQRETTSLLPTSMCCPANRIEFILALRVCRAACRDLGHFPFSSTSTPEENLNVRPSCNIQKGRNRLTLRGQSCDFTDRTENWRQAQNLDT